MCNELKIVEGTYKTETCRNIFAFRVVFEGNNTKEFWSPENIQEEVKEAIIKTCKNGAKINTRTYICKSNVEVVIGKINDETRKVCNKRPISFSL